MSSPERPPTPATGEGKILEDPQVKSLVEKACAEPERRIPQGTVKTGADLPGGGGTKSLDPVPPKPE